MQLAFKHANETRCRNFCNKKVSVPAYGSMDRSEYAKATIESFRWLARRSGIVTGALVQTCQFSRVENASTLLTQLHRPSGRDRKGTYRTWHFPNCWVGRQRQYNGLIALGEEENPKDFDNAG